jgi:hypothetical protein
VDAKGWRNKPAENDRNQDRREQQCEQDLITRRVYQEGTKTPAVLFIPIGPS